MWNCRERLRDIDGSSFFLDHLQFIVIFIQERILKSSHKNIFRHYSVFRKDRTVALQWSGAVAVVLQGQAAGDEIALVAPLAAVTVRVLLDHPLTLCSQYILPNSSPHTQKLYALITQPPTLFLLYGWL